MVLERATWHEDGTNHGCGRVVVHRSGDIRNTKRAGICPAHRLPIGQYATTDGELGCLRKVPQNGLRGLIVGFLLRFRREFGVAVADFLAVPPEAPTIVEID